MGPDWNADRAGRTHLRSDLRDFVHRRATVPEVRIADRSPSTVDTYQDITDWLNRQPEEDAIDDAGVAEGEPFDALYQDLHRVARSHMFREQPGHTLSATALTHEAWFRMKEQTRTRWASRSHYLAVASTMMRRILVNHAVAKRATRRNAATTSLTAAEWVPAPERDDELIAVHEALLAFAAVDTRAAQVVELKFFGGMENGEVAEALGISVATVKRDWQLARAWLWRELQGA